MTFAINIIDKRSLSLDVASATYRGSKLQFSRVNNEVCHEFLPKKTRCCISCLFHSKRHYTRYVLLTRWSTPVIQVGMPCG